MELREPYKSLLADNKIIEYASSLCRDGIKWWAEMDTPAVIAHLMPLQKFASGPIAPPPRLAFLADAVKSEIPLESIERHFESFMKTGDYEAAAAAVGAGVASIWDSGREFSRYSKWYDRILSLMDMGEKLPPLSLASLHGFKGLVELTGRGEIGKALDSYDSMRRYAEEAGSISLRVFYSAAACYSLLWTGQLSRAGITIDDAIALLENDDVSVVCKTYFMTTLGLYQTMIGHPNHAKRTLLQIIEMPLFEQFPPPAYFLCYGHLLHAIAYESDMGMISQTSAKVRERAIPKQNYFHYSYLHFSLGVAYLAAGDARKALIHSNEAIDRGRSSESPIAEHMPSLLRGQALSDMGDIDEALAHLLKWIERWRESGFMLLASSGSVEAANLYRKKGMTDMARKYLDIASDLAPDGIEIVPLYRPPSFIQDLRNFLKISDDRHIMVDHPDDYPVQITAFGALRIKINDRLIYDRRWLGGRTQTLLKLLIVSGGQKVPYSHLSDILWPDAEGDAAERNLKVAISRLRRIDCSPGQKATNWIAVKNKRVSLVRSLCHVDTIVFKETVDAFLTGDADADSMMKALSLYTDDFLVQDVEHTWIVRHREQLKGLFIKGAVALSESLKRPVEREDAIPFLLRAVEIDPLQEEPYIHLIHTYMNSYPSKAAKIYQEAKTALMDGLGIEPGPALTSVAREYGLIK